MGGSGSGMSGRQDGRHGTGQYASTSVPYDELLECEHNQVTIEAGHARQLGKQPKAHALHAAFCISVGQCVACARACHSYSVP